MLGKWNHLLDVEGPAGSTPGMYVSIVGFVGEAYTGSHAMQFANSSWNKIRDSWISDVNTTGATAALYIENGYEFDATGNFLNNSDGYAAVQLNGGGRMNFAGNTFIGQAFSFDATNDTTQSVVGFNRYNGTIQSQQAKWLAFVTPGVSTTKPIISPFHAQIGDVANTGLTLEGIASGTTTGKKYLTISTAGALNVLADDGTTNIFQLADNGVVFGVAPVLSDPGAKPACDSSHAGQIFRDAGAAGVADTVEICGKNSSDTYAWYALASIP